MGLHLAPADAAREDDRLGADHVTVVEVHLARRDVDPVNRPRDEDLGARVVVIVTARGSRAQRLRPRTGTRGSSRSATRSRPARPALRARPRSSANPRTRRRPRQRDRRGRRRRSRCRTPRFFGLGPQPQQLRDAPQPRPHDRLAAHDPDHRPITRRRQRPTPRLSSSSALSKPRKRDLITIQKMAQRRRRHIHPTPHHNRPRLLLFSRERGQATIAPHPVVREVADLLADIGHLSRKRVIITRLTLITRVGSAARKPTGNTVPSTIGTSPKMSPGSRLPSTRSTPSTPRTGSIRPSITANNARSSPSCAAYSPFTSGHQQPHD